MLIGHRNSRHQLFPCAALATCIGICICSATTGATPQASDARWAASEGEVKDGFTGLRWMSSDNGSDINWKDAKAYCASRGEGWRLPTIDELRSLYVGNAEASAQAKCGDSICRTAPQFTLSSAWLWSSTPVGADAYDGDELAWGISLANGKRTQSVKELSYGSRALCVR